MFLSTDTLSAAYAALQEVRDATRERVASGVTPPDSIEMAEFNIQAYGVAMVEIRAELESRNVSIIAFQFEDSNNAAN